MDEIYRKNAKLFGILFLLVSSISVLNLFNNFIIGSGINISFQNITKWDVLKSWYYIVFISLLMTYFNFNLKKKFLISLGYFIAFLCTLYLAINSSKIL